MKKKIFISYSYSNRHSFADFHERLKEYLVKELEFEVYSFVYDFKDKVSDRELMDKALGEILSSDMLFVELSYESVGIGIEAGYAKSNNIPIIYLAKDGIDMDPTMMGISNHIVKYSSVDDVIKWVSENREVFLK